MSNYEEGSHAYEGSPGAAGYPEQGRQPEGAPYRGGPQGEPQYAGGQYQGGQGYPETRQFSGYQGGPQYQGGSSHRGRDFSLRSTFKTTEFWIFVVVAVGMLIAAAVTDERADGQGFGAQDAWRYITALAIGYFLSRGLTKFGGHEHDTEDNRHH